ncbi:ATP-binding cassette domain-containing protein [Castellaniella sp.]|uniref:ABC transporter ATP-binding protein n=1 Tax=Castellaniella sp. TaxID=1955812 RepID=UPI0025BF6641|nr:ATP-binding cassette domain-containing protein [Castellaniella sp.]
MSDSQPILLTAQGLSCAVSGRQLWRAIRLEIGAGERWAVTGPSGSGKTVFLRTLAGLMPRQTGEICLRGRPFDQVWAPAWRAQVVYVPQRPALPEGSVQAALAAPFGFRVHRGRAFSPETAGGYLSQIGMAADFLRQDVATLSGGEAQVVAVLRALLIQPSILLLDEPTASLDPTRAANVEALVHHWQTAASGRACVWTSHDPAQLTRVSDLRLPIGSPP